MAKVLECPNTDQLRLLARGEIIGPECDQLLAHLDQCEPCAAALQPLLAEDTVTDSLRNKGTVDDSRELSEVQQLVEKLRTLGPGSQAGMAPEDSVTRLPLNPAEDNNPQPTQSEPAAAADPTKDEDDDCLAPPQGPDELGRLGSYRILKVLGAGGMGKVYLAEDPGLQRKVALKVMKLSLARNAQARQRFLQEARLAAMIEHDHIVHIYQVGEDRNVPFLAMQLLSGESLDDLLHRAGALPARQTVHIGAQIAAGLAAAHERGLIHRDIKPGNIWIEKNVSKAHGLLALGLDRVKILDFGLARSVESDTSLTQTGAIIGTPAYMAPEQAQGDFVDHRCDLYSLGCVLYRMVTGDLPIKGKHTLGLLMALATQDPTAPSLIKKEIPPALSELIMKLLAKEPDQRPRSAVEVYQALKAMEQELTSVAPGDTLAGSELKQEVVQELRRQASLVSMGGPTSEGTLTPASLPLPTRQAKLTQAARHRGWAIAVVLLVGLIGAWAVYQLIFRTPDGNLVVEIDGPDVEARFKDGQLRLYDAKGELKYTLKPSDKNKSLPAGKYKIEVAGADGLKLDTEKFEMTKAGFKVRVTLDQSALAKLDPLKKEGTPDRDKPFVLVRAGQPVREFKSLGGALAEQKIGDVIEIHGNGPFDLAGLDRIDKQLRLKAAPGYRPWLVVRASIMVNDALLDIEGCDFDSRQALRLFEGNGPSWEFRRCRFWGSMLLYTGPRVRVAACLILTPSNFLGVYSDCQVEIENCMTHCHNAVVDVSGSNSSIQLKNSTLALVGFRAPTVFDIHENSKGVKVEAEGNLFILRNSRTGGPLHVQQLNQLDAKGLAKQVQWQGKDNLFAGPWSLVPNKLVDETLGDWNKLWPRAEERSRGLSDVNMEWSRYNGTPLAETRRHFERVVASAQQRHKLAELGPDWNLIGPGDAYVRFRELADGKPIPKDQLRVEVTDGKPYLILREGKQAASFRDLQAAVDAAKDGDVIELHSDFESPGVQPNGKQRLMTLRAGLGYSPRVNGLTNLGDDRLILEGLSFTHAVWLSQHDPAKGFGSDGELVRITNCSVSQILGWFHHPKGQQVLIRNCFVSEQIHVGMKGSTTRLANCFIRQVVAYPRAKENCRLELDRCVVASQEVNGGTIASFGAPTTPTPITFALEKTYVESPLYLLHSNEEVKWEGRGNVYSVPVSYDYGRGPFHSLDSFRKKHQSDADSFEDRPLLLDPAYWRVRPETPKYSKRPDGRDYGADVTRILGPRQDAKGTPLAGPMVP